MSKYTTKTLIQEVANILEVDKINWPALIKLANQIVLSGFTREDILLAANNMKKGDRKFWSIYSVFNKPDYWMSIYPKEENKKGVWNG